MTALNVQVLRIIKELEEIKAAPYLKRGGSKRRLRLIGKYGVDERTCQEAISRRIGVSADYAGRLCRALCKDGFLLKNQEGGYTLTLKGMKSIAREFSGRVTKGRVKTIMESF